MLNTHRLEKGSIDLPLKIQAILGTILSIEGRSNELQRESDKVTQRITTAHPMREIELSVKRLHQAGVNLRGMLINDMDMRSRRYGKGKLSYQYSCAK